ncbi:hypothetical protein M5K25_026612 [Dendrobium thyrsiflorum]|uniref:Uncharacterized protein n=1 Tax=Dendrobium thyrsiflorum TaxID=117978 RepID=A0ABD0TY29_DENTH
MASKSIVHDVAAYQDALRFGLDGVKGEIVGSHPLEYLRETARRDLVENKRLITDLTYGSAFNLKMDLDKQILSRFQRPPGMLPSSMVGFEALTGGLEDFGFEDYLNDWYALLAMWISIKYLTTTKLTKINKENRKTHESKSSLVYAVPEMVCDTKEICDICKVGKRGWSLPENLEQELDERSDFGKEVARQFPYVAVNKRRQMIAEQEGNGYQDMAPLPRLMKGELMWKKKPIFGMQRRGLKQRFQQGGTAELSKSGRALSLGKHGPMYSLLFSLEQCYILNAISEVPQDAETFRPVDMHHGMEVHLGISKGPVCPSFM